MSSNNNNNNNNNTPPTPNHRANTSARRSRDTYFQVSQLAAAPRWAGLRVCSASRQHELFARGRQCGNAAAHPRPSSRPRLQYLEYVGEAYDPADARGERLIRTPLCRDCAFAIRPAFVLGIEEARRSSSSGGESRERGRERERQPGRRRRGQGGGGGDEDALYYANWWLGRSYANQGP